MFLMCLFYCMAEVWDAVVVIVVIHDVHVWEMHLLNEGGSHLGGVALPLIGPVSGVNPKSLCAASQMSHTIQNN